MPNNFPKNVVDLRNVKLPAPKEAAKPALSPSSNLPFMLPPLPAEPKQLESPNASTQENDQGVSRQEQEEEPRLIAADHPNAILQWVAPEFDYQEKDKTLWLFAIGGSATLISIFFILLFKRGAYTSVLVTIAGAVALLLLAFRKPRRVSCGIAPGGIFAGTKFFPFETLESFWIFYHPPAIKELSLRSKKLLMPHIIIPLGEQDPSEVRTKLVQLLHEEEQHLTLLDVVAKRLGL